MNIDSSFIEHLEGLIQDKQDKTILSLLSEEHPADIAEIISELDLEEATYLFKLLDSDRTSDALLEIDEDDREKILKNLSVQEIAEEIQQSLDFLRAEMADMPERQRSIRAVIDPARDSRRRAGEPAGRLQPGWRPGAAA